LRARSVQKIPLILGFKTPLFEGARFQNRAERSVDLQNRPSGFVHPAERSVRKNPLNDLKNAKKIQPIVFRLKGRRRLAGFSSLF
jgi:hypothetical protein